MSGFYGADVEQLRVLGRDLSTSADQLDQVLVRLGARVDDTPWQGPDADRFRNEWHGLHTRSVRLVVAALRDAAGAATANATQQESTSGGGFAPLPGFVPVPGAPIIPEAPGDLRLPPTLPTPIVPDDPGDFVGLPGDLVDPGIPVPPLPKLDPESIARDMAYVEGRDWMNYDGKSVPIQADIDGDIVSRYIEVDGRRIYDGDADWPPVTPHEIRVTADRPTEA